MEEKEIKDLLKNKKIKKSLQNIANLIDGKEVTGLSFIFQDGDKTQKVDWDKNTKDKIKKL